MTPELTVLALAILLQGVQFALFAVPANLELGPRLPMGPRDEPGIEGRLSVRTGRLRRAFLNHFEALALFAPAALTVAVSGQSTAVTAACAWIYLGARALYVPAYAFGWVPGRSLIWAAGFGATLVMAAAAVI